MSDEGGEPTAVPYYECITVTFDVFVSKFDTRLMIGYAPIMKDGYSSRKLFY